MWIRQLYSPVEMITMLNPKMMQVMLVPGLVLWTYTMHILTPTCKAHQPDDSEPALLHKMRAGRTTTTTE